MDVSDHGAPQVGISEIFQLHAGKFLSLLSTLTFPSSLFFPLVLIPGGVSIAVQVGPHLSSPSYKYGHPPIVRDFPNDAMLIDPSVAIKNPYRTAKPPKSTWTNPSKAPLIPYRHS